MVIDEDNDDRVFCRQCTNWWFPDTPQTPKLCESCEERYCEGCKPNHKCWTEGPS